MITLLYLVAGAFMQSVTFVLSSINYIPQIASLTGSIGYFLSFTGYFYGVIDIPRFYTDLGIAIGFELFWFGFLIVWWVIGFFRSLISVGGTETH